MALGMYQKNLKMSFEIDHHLEIDHHFEIDDHYLEIDHCMEIVETINRYLFQDLVADLVQSYHRQVHVPNQT